MFVSLERMSWGVYLSLLVVLVQVLGIRGVTNSDDFAGLQALRNEWTNVPPNWDGADPCGNRWDGITCANNRIVSITLASISLSGRLTSDLGRLSQLQILDLSYNTGLTGPLPPGLGDLTRLTSLILVGCGFSGQIPSSIGSLRELVYLSLNSNSFIGRIPPSIGNLQNLYWLDLADNELTGPIPVSDGTTPGLDMLLQTKHFHFGRNQLSGEIPPQLFSSNMTLLHVLLENNRLTGPIPSSLGLVRTLEVVRLDRNSLSGPVPRNLNSLTTVQELYLSNNRLTGSLPNLTGMDSLNYVDMSNNSFDPTEVPLWFSSLESLTTLFMESTHIRGQLPVSIFSPFQLQTIVLKNNQLNGTLSIGSGYSSQLQLIDLEGNFIDDFTERDGSNVTVVLVGNPICTERGVGSYCSLPAPTNTTYSTPPQNCIPDPCSSDRVSSPTCQCAYPYTGNLVFRAPSFSNFGNSTIFASLQNGLMTSFRSSGLAVDSVAVSNPTKDIDNYLVLNLQVFPSNQDYFNHTGILSIGFMLSNQTFKPPHGFGPFYFIANNYPNFAGLSGGHRSNIGIIIGASVGGAVLFLLLLLAGGYAFRQKRRAETAKRHNDPFASWDPKTNSVGVPQLMGAKFFTFEELKKCTNNFSETNNIGSGGYGRVYKGTLPNGQMVAIKRAQQGSMQGGLEFKTEIELLSRVHHKNVVRLVGFCFDQGEQMLVYEFIANGTLKDSLSGTSGIRLDWMRRLRIALGAAKGLQYLHDLANPPIIHRDIKSTNILLDERLTAKVADFGLSKLMGEGDSEKTHITTQVKGTLGYLDPEYYMTNQLTEKSDVYSFGITLLELLTARNPIEKGKYIVTEVKRVMDKSKDMYNLQEILDPVFASNAEPRSVEKLVDLSLRCVQESGSSRPHMSDVVKEIENIMESIGLNPNAESTSTSASYEKTSKDFDHPYNNNENLFEYSGTYVSSDLKPK